MTEIEKAAKDYCLRQPKWLAATVEAAFEMGAIWATERAAKIAETWYCEFTAKLDPNDPIVAGVSKDIATAIREGVGK